MTFWFFFFSFVLGTIIGSFLNVVALRYGTKKNLGGRSGCMACGETLYWFELLPLVSYLGLNGKCRTCKTKISIQYPLVEFATGLIFAMIFLKFLPILETFPQIFLMSYILSAVIFSILMVIVVYDIRHKIIPDGLVFSFIILSLIFLIFRAGGVGGISVFPGFLDFLAGPILALPFALLWLVSGGRWIGFGDAKLAWGMGWFLGFAGGLSAIALGFWTGALVALSILLFSKLGKTSIMIGRKTEIPFAPFLIFGLLVIFFWQFDFFHVHELLMYAV